MWQHNVWCVCVRSVWRGMLDCSLCALCGEVCWTAVCTFCVESYVGLQSVRSVWRVMLDCSLCVLCGVMLDCSLCVLCGEECWTAVCAFCVERYVGLQSVRSVWRGMLDCSPAYLSTQNVRLPHHHIAFVHFKHIFEISDFNKEHTSSLKMI